MNYGFGFDADQPEPIRTTAVSTNHREANILAAMGKATLEEQRVLAAELEEIRATRRMAVQADRDVDLADAVIRDHLTPVVTTSKHTASTDWLMEEETAPEQKVAGHEVLAQASLWFGKVSNEVKADADEFTEQAKGTARRVAGAYGERAPEVERSFMDHVAFLHRRHADSSGQNGLGESTVTDYKTKADQDPLYAEDWDNEGADEVSSERAPMIQENKDGSDSKRNQEAHASRRSRHVAADGYQEPGGNTFTLSPGGPDYIGSKSDAWLDDQIDWWQREMGKPSSDPSRIADGQIEATLRLLTEEHARRQGVQYEDLPRHASRRYASESGDAAWSRPKESSLHKTASRSLNEIAHEISRTWPNVYFGARPYLDAMSQLDSIDDQYYADTAASIVTYFLGNATTWRGEDARRIKAELKAMLKGSRRGYSLNATAGEVPEQFKNSGGDSDGSTCSVCGDKIAKDPSGENPSTYHHDNGEKHDHEAKPKSGDSKESRRTASVLPSQGRFNAFAERLRSNL